MGGLGHNGPARRLDENELVALQVPTLEDTWLGWLGRGGVHVFLMFLDVFGLEKCGKVDLDVFVVFGVREV